MYNYNKFKVEMDMIAHAMGYKVEINVAEEKEDNEACRMVYKYDVVRVSAYNDCCEKYEVFKVNRFEDDSYRTNLLLEASAKLVDRMMYNKDNVMITGLQGDDILNQFKENYNGTHEVYCTQYVAEKEDFGGQYSPAHGGFIFPGVHDIKISQKPKD